MAFDLENAMDYDNMDYDTAMLYMTLYRQKLVGCPTDGIDKDIEAYDIAIEALDYRKEHPDKTGKWLHEDSNFIDGKLSCSECNFLIDVNVGQYKFCPNCGIRMNVITKKFTDFEEAGYFAAIVDGTVKSCSSKEEGKYWMVDYQKENK